VVAVVVKAQLAVMVLAVQVALVVQVLTFLFLLEGHQLLSLVVVVPKEQSQVVQQVHQQVGTVYQATQALVLMQQQPPTVQAAVAVIQQVAQVQTVLFM
jgi:hypothetical protein